MDETTKRMRDEVYTRTKNATPEQGMPPEWVSLYVLFQILDMLDSIDSRLIGVENAVSNVEEAVGNLNRGRV